MDGVHEGRVALRPSARLSPEDAIDLVGEGHRIARGVPFPAPDVGQALRLRQEHLALLQLLLRAPPLLQLALQVARAVLHALLQRAAGLLEVGIPLLDAGQHLVEGVDQLADLVAALRSHAHRVVLLARDPAGPLRQPDDRARDDGLHPRREGEREQERDRGDDGHQRGVAQQTRPHVLEITLQDHRAHGLVVEEDGP